MNWLTPSVIATMAGTALLSFIFFYLYVHDRHKHLAVWASSWAIYFFRYVFMLLVIAGYKNSFFLIANQTASLLSGVILLWGTYLFIEKPFPKIWIYSCFAGILWIIYSISMDLPFLIMSVPTFTFLSVVYIWTGIKLIQSGVPGDNGKSITGWAFVVWGIHKANYPFLRPVAWFAPWGYLIAAVLEFLVALGMLLIYFHKIRTDLKRDQAFLKKAQEIGKIGTWALDIKRNELIWTEEVYRIFELPAGAKLTYEKFMDCVHPDDREYVDRQWKASFDKKPYDIEHRLLVDGKIKWVREKAELEFDEKNVCIRGIGFAQDITDRKHAEEVLRESEKKYRAIFENANEGILVVQEEKIKLANPATEKITGYRLDVLTSQPFTRFIHPDDREPVLERYKEKILGGAQAAFSYAFRLITRSGEDKLIEIHASMLEWEGRPSMLIFLQDVTERRRAAAERARLISAVEHANEMFMITDTGGVIQYVNPAFTRVTGYTREEAVGQTPRLLKSGAQDKAFYQHLWQKILTGDAWQGRMINRRKNGALYTEEATVSPVFGGDGKIMNFVAVKRDVTTELQIEERLRQAQKMESIGVLAGGIAHDFNNILFPIIGMTEMLLEDLPPDSLDHENAREILKAGKRGSDLVKQILAFSRQAEHKKIPVRPQQVLKEVVNLMRSTIPSNITINSSLQENCGLVMADPTQLHQVAMNLLTNAYHAVERKEGAITVKLQETVLEEKGTPGSPLAPGRYALITVADTGCGIPPDIRHKIFEPYFTTKEQGKGTGLGLAVVYGIVKNHGGAIHFDSEPGKGTSVGVYLPLIARTNSQIHEETRKSIPRGNERILLVDDEKSIVQLEKKMLERLGYTVAVHSGSLEALEAFKTDPAAYDLVITDMTMPNLTGEKLAQLMIAIRPDIPIIICTGYSEWIDMEKAAANGIRGFLMKPVTHSEMAETVRNALDGKRGGQNLHSWIRDAPASF